MRETDEFDDPAARILGNIARTVSLRNRVGERGRIFPALAIFGLIFLIGAVAWFSYPRERDRFDDMNAPVIRADADMAEFRAAAPEEGGVEIPYRDSTVFDTLRAARNENGERKIESLLPPAEEPLPRDKIFAGMKRELKVEPVLKAEAGPEEDMAATEDLLAEADKPEIQEQPGIQPAENVEEARAVTAAQAPRPTTKPDSVAEREASGAASTEPAAGDAKRSVSNKAGDYFLQLGSMGSAEAAKQAWQQYQGSYTELAGLALHVEKADLGGRGTFYRVQAGPLDEAQARSLCSSITAKRPGGCLVVTH